MVGIVAPIHTGTLGGKPLRFFKAPLPGPHLVWHAPEDLYLCLGLPRDLRRHFRQRLQTSDWSKDVRTVATAEGIAMIAPHWMAQGMIGSMIENGLSPASIETAYAMQAAEAWKALAGDLPPGASVELMIEAFQNSNGIGGRA